MGNFIDYIRESGKETFAQRAFTEVDNLVLAMTSYIDFRGIAASMEENQRITVEQAAKRYCELHENQIPEELEAMAESKRFGQLLLSDYEEVFRTAKEKTQFAAVHISSEDGFDYISFRGTDESFVGWRENFTMSYQVIPAQRHAADYLNRILDRVNHSIYVGGHSKGGMLSVYAAASLTSEKAKQIKKIFSNDGPWLCKDIIDEKSYLGIKDKIIRISPDFSIIGTLFSKEKPDIIIKSSANGPGEHDAFTWQICNHQFMHSDDLQDKCKVYCRIIDGWMKKVSLTEREIFVKDLFHALEQAGAPSMYQLGTVGAGGLKRILFTFGKGRKESKLVMGKLFGQFLYGIFANFGVYFHREAVA